jgi:hypothetical protein
MPHGFTWGLVLLKDLSKPPRLVRTYMMKNHFENMLAILRAQWLMDLHGV